MPATNGAPAGHGQPARLRVRGLVQGVGFRPTVWRLAHDLGLTGDVRNDGDGVLIRLWATPDQVQAFCAALREHRPPLARIDAIERLPDLQPCPPSAKGFQIIASAATAVRTGVVPDAAICAACAAEVRDPHNRRYRYPFTNCTHCGPRLSILRAIPYDRANTSMAAFHQCPACTAEYGDPADRRFHAQPNACPVCGPRVWLVDAVGRELDPSEHGAEDALALASRLLAAGKILAIKGIGGFHLACDASNSEAVAELRRRKRRHAKPFALMGRDLAVIRRWCRVSAEEAALLAAPAAPILLLERRADAPPLAEAVAPGQDTLGFLLPYSPLHLLLLADWERPLVMTSGNRSDEPQCIANADAAERLGGIADYRLLHDRDIVNRVDDSVMRLMAGRPRWLRRARGGAPAPLPLPPGLHDLPPVLALGGELKNTLCLLKEGQAILSQHLGDLQDARTAREFARTIDLYLELYQHRPAALAVDLHPDYYSTQVGQRLADRLGVPLIPLQHHGAHLAAVLADAGWPADAGPVLGLILDGLGQGTDGRVWGGELLYGDYRGAQRLGHLRPAPLPGGARAIVEPWRNLYAWLVTAFGWEQAVARWGGLPALAALGGKPLQVLDQMIGSGLGTPLSSSAGRLFDAVAAALGVCFDGIAYEGQAAIELEVLARQGGDAGAGYPFDLTRAGGPASARPPAADGPRAAQPVAGVALAEDPWMLDPAPMWAALLDDLAAGVSAAQIAARFHAGLAAALIALAREAAADVVALSGGVFQNRTLFEALVRGLEAAGLRVLTHTQVPTNDGGLALGQAVMAGMVLAGEASVRSRVVPGPPAREPPVAAHRSARHGPQGPG